jgi:hypothetical protein
MDVPSLHWHTQLEFVEPVSIRITVRGVVKVS